MALNGLLHLTHERPFEGLAMDGPVALVVDEEDATRTLLAGVLGRLGFRTIEAANQATAAVQLRRGMVRLLFVDLQLPEGGAEGLITMAQSYNPQYRLVVMTRRPSLESAVGAVRVGACDYLVKPLSSDKIQTACSRALAARAGAESPSVSTSAELDFASQNAGVDDIEGDETMSVSHGQHRFDPPVPIEMTVNVPLVGDFRKISQCLVREALAKFRGNKAAAARALGMHRKTLYRLLQTDRDYPGEP